MLTDAECKNAVCPPGKKRARLACSGGLYLEVSPAGSKRWFYKYRKDGKEGRMALGGYPDVGAKDARKARDAAKLQKSEGRDPVQVRKVEKLKALTPAADTFKATALEWYAMKLDSWSSHYAIREKRNLEKDLFPFLGARHIGEVEAIELLATVRRVEERGALDVAHRVPVGRQADRPWRRDSGRTGHGMKMRAHRPHAVSRTLRTLRTQRTLQAPAVATRSALAEQVHVKLRSDILHARLRPGEALSENGLAARLAVSRTPVREAIQRLMREGLVQVLPQRGSYVGLLSIQRIRDALFVREAVETQAMRRLLAAPDDQALVPALEASIARQAAALAAGDLEATMRADADFHLSLLHGAGLDGVWPIVAQARDMHQRTRAIAVPELQSGEQALADHRAIVAALRARDLPRSIQAMSDHLQRNEAITLRVATLHPDYFAAEDADAVA